MDGSGHPVDRLSRDVLNSTPDAILLVDLDGTIIDANDTLTDIFGYESDEFLDESIELLVPEGVRDAHIDHRSAYMATPESRPMGLGLDLLGQRKDGETFPVEVSLSPTTIDGETGVVTVIRDVSDREALRTKYRALLETAPDAFFVADLATGELIEVNDRAVELMGYSRDELLGLPQVELHPNDDAGRYRELFESHAKDEGIRTTMPDGSPIFVETKDGDRLPVEINAAVVELGDRRLATGTFRDISDRRERERELKRTETIIEASGDAVYMLDPTGKLTFVNAALERMTGYEATELLGEHISKVMRRRDVETGRDVIRTLLRSGRNRETFEMDLLRADGESIPTENHVAILQTEEGTLEASVGVLRDISKRREHERHLERQNQRLDAFASLVSHDLRNPLSVAIGTLELAREDGESEYFDGMANALGRMEEIVRDTLTLAREGTAVGETFPVDLSALADQCWQFVDSAEATLHVESMAPIQADRSRLQHLFENLFRNAVEQGGPNVTIEIGGLENGFFVEDTGPGIPRAERERIFEPGYSPAGGTGLGLAIVKAIVDAHGWDIEVGERDTGGARFAITGVEASAGEPTDR